MTSLLRQSSDVSDLQRIAPQPLGGQALANLSRPSTQVIISRDNDQSGELSSLILGIMTSQVSYPPLLSGLWSVRWAILPYSQDNDQSGQPSSLTLKIMTSQVSDPPLPSGKWPVRWAILPYFPAHDSLIPYNTVRPLHLSVGNLMMTPVEADGSIIYTETLHSTGNYTDDQLTVVQVRTSPLSPFLNLPIPSHSSPSFPS